MKLNLQTTNEITNVVVLGISAIAGLYGAVGIAIAGISIYLLGTIIKPKDLK